LGPGLPDRFQWVVWSTVGHSLVAAAHNDLYYIGDVTKAASTSHRSLFCRHPTGDVDSIL
jgi:hypothetical protein